MGSETKLSLKTASRKVSGFDQERSSLNLDLLLDCLDKEIDIYEDILEIVKQKQHLLIQNKGLEIESLLSDLNKKTVQATKLDRQRVEILKTFGMENKNLTWLENYISTVRSFEKKQSGNNFLVEDKRQNDAGSISGGTVDSFNEHSTAPQIFNEIPDSSLELIIMKTKRIKELILQISEVNNSNIFLIDQGRKNIKAYFDIIFKQFGSSTYSNSGIIQSSQYKNVLLDKNL